MDRLQLRNRNAPPRGTPFEEMPEVQDIRDAIGRTGASFFFVLSGREFDRNFPIDPERKQRRYMALTRWAEDSGGRLAFIRDEFDVKTLIEEINQVPGTSYRLEYRSSPNPSAPDTRTIEVRVSNPALRVLQSRTLVPEN